MASAVTLGIPTPAFSTALAFFDGYRSARLPANLIQVKHNQFLAFKTYYQFLVQGKTKFCQIGLMQGFYLSMI